MMRREFLAGVVAAPLAAARSRRTRMGFTSDSFAMIRWSSPQQILEVDRLMELAVEFGAGGAHGGMTDVSFAYARKVREMKEKYGLYVEIQTFLPRLGEDPSVFEHAVRVSKEAGASSLRVVCLLGRRYEMFNTAAEWRQAVAGFHKQIATAVPIVEKYKMPLGIETHKDWTVEEQLALTRSYSSEYLGVCLDTGNNISLLDDMMEVVEKLAPYTFNVHLKDMAVEEYEEGFLLAEVPLGEGMLDMKRIVDTIRKARPEVNFSLEMITRDPLQIPCLTEKYWATFPERNGVYLARTLRMVRNNKPKKPLPRITGLSDAQRAQLERDHVERSIQYAIQHLGLGV
jgi:sugar phosphate isomerase/epimerase